MRQMRQMREKIFISICRLFAWSAVIILVFLVGTILLDGFQVMKPHFFTAPPSRFAEKAGIYPALMGSVWIILLTALISVPVGVATAIFLEEYAPKNKFFQVVEINIATLAGMPSIVYGLLALTIFVRLFGLNRSVLSGALCLSLLILPTIIIAAQGAIRAVPQTLRDAAFALGARRYQVIFGQVLPAAIPGIMTGIILALSRAMGESAPLILLGAFSYIAFAPESMMDSFTVLPVQIFNWAGRPQPEFHALAAGGIIVLVVLLFALNFSAIYIRNRFQRYK
jgi:phosphate transport system permease protein